MSYRSNIFSKGNTQGVVYTPILDDYTALVGYSTMKLKSSITSPMTLKNNSGVVSDLLYGSSKSYDLTSYLSNGQTFNEFKESNNIKLTVLKDQSGNGKDISAVSAFEPLISNATDIYKTDGQPSIYFDSKRLERAALPELAIGNNFTVYSVSAVKSGSAIGVILNTSSTDTNRLVQFADLRTIKRNAFLQTASGSYASDMSQARTTPDKNVLKVFSIGGSGTSVSSWDNKSNGQQNVAIVGTYTNDILKIGSQHLNLLPLTGYVQLLIIRSGVDSDIVRNDISDRINQMFNIY